MTATSAPTPSTWGRTTIARLAGGLYLAYILANVLASLVGHIGLGDARTLRETIADHEVMFRVGLVAALASGLLFVLTAWALDVLLRPVNEPLALLLLALNAVGVAIQCASYLTLSTVLAQSEGTVGTNELTGSQLDSLAMLWINTYRTGFVTAQLFFSAWLFPLGWLVLRCGFLPRALGWLLLLDGVAVLGWFLQALLAPDYPAISYPSWAIGFIAELGLALWLLVKGVRPETPPKVLTVELPGEISCAGRDDSRPTHGPRRWAARSRSHKDPDLVRPPPIRTLSPVRLHLPIPARDVSLHRPAHHPISTFDSHAGSASPPADGLEGTDCPQSVPSMVTVAPALQGCGGFGPDAATSSRRDRTRSGGADRRWRSWRPSSDARSRPRGRGRR